MQRRCTHPNFTLKTMFENLSLPHLLMVLAVAILVFGPKRIPEIAGSLGKGIREFKRHIGEVSRPDGPTDRPEISRSGSNEIVSVTSNEMTRAIPPESNDRGEPKRLLD
ncbi:MAG TPA: twin-arginine translocase TatA/TatE family subunit [Gemmatimonadaceae bacterium]